MSYLDRLKDRFPDNCPTEVPQKLQEAPFCSSCSTRVGRKKASDGRSPQDPDSDLPALSPELAARLSPEDIADIEAGDISPDTVAAFEQAAIAREAEALREYFEERTGILEHDAGMVRADAQIEAARSASALARNCKYAWEALRSALSDYPTLRSQVPYRPGPIDSLPFATAKVHVRGDAKPGPVSGSIVITEAEIEAARKGRIVVKQGTFTGAPEVKP